MAEVCLGEIRQFPYTRIPTGWLPCDGRLLAVTSYQALFSLLYTTYGGDGRTTFGIPDLRGRAIVGAPAANSGQGVKGGLEQVTLTTSEIPAHTHQLYATSSDGETIKPNDGYMAVPVPPPNLTDPPGPPNIYGNAQHLVSLHASSITIKGGSAPHENRQPFLAMYYCIATVGYYPQRP